MKRGLEYFLIVYGVSKLWVDIRFFFRVYIVLFFLNWSVCCDFYCSIIFSILYVFDGVIFWLKYWIKIYRVIRILKCKSKEKIDYLVIYFYF